MKLKNSFFYTIRENIKDEDSISSKLLVRSGMIKKSSNGIYMYMPLGLKVLKNIENVIREEMNNINSLELLMPTLIPEDMFEQSGRLQNFGKEMFKLNDRYNRKYVLGPTHEELFTVAGMMGTKSYKDLPFSLYQIQNKFRDEPRPRYGLIRVREFSMKDAYSFDKDVEGLNKSYRLMDGAYREIFNRLGLNYKVVKADTGSMGGLLSEEFQAITSIGEDTIVYCESCDFSTNLEVAECKDIMMENNEERLPIREVYTPMSKTIQEVAAFFKKDPRDFVKTLIYKADNNLYACLVRGDRELNELKLKKLLNAKEVELVDFDTVRLITNAEVGFAGPIGLGIPIVIDNEIKYLKNFIVGANKTDYHFINANLNIDFKYHYIGDIRNIMPDDLCPKCLNKLTFKKGIEIGNIFKLGTKYSEALGLNYLDADNKLNPVVMGCYGIGLGRCMAAIVEQYNDEKGIVWPINIAPFKVGIVIISDKDENQINYANKLYEELTNLGIQTILDDRNERCGVKFNDMDLIGIPIRITIGNKITDNLVEVKLRNEDEINNIKIEDLIIEIKRLVNN